MVHPERVLDVNRAFAFDAEIAVARHGKTIFQRLFQPLVHALEKFLFREFSHRLVIPRKQTPRRIETEQRHRMESLFSQFRRENAVIGQGVAIDFTRCFVRQPALARLVITEIHLLVTFIAMERPAERLGRRAFFRFQLRQAAQEHVDLEHGPFVRGIRLI